MLKATLLAASLALAMAAGAAQAAGAAVKIMGPHASLPCSTCHDGKVPTKPGKDKCLACHGSYEQVAKRTEKMNPNPHFSHRGEPDCANCHSMHGKSRLECNDCHTFDIKMKGN